LKKFSLFCTSILLTPPAVAGYKPKNTAMYTTTSTAAQFKEIAGCTCKLLTEEVIDWLSQLHSEFNAKRLSLLEARNKRQAGYGDGLLPDFPIETHAIRQAKWQVATIPADLQKRNVEITGPVDRKMIINALNSGADVFMADFEDANSPTWENCLKGQLNLQKAIRRTIDFTTNEGKTYQLAEKTATLMVRPRGWHLNERHFTLQNVPISASLFDFGVFMFHNANTLIEKGSGPYFYLPKLEHYLEARLWNDVFDFAESYFGLKPGTIRCTVLIETIEAALQMEEILYELRHHIVALNAGRWDYIFSIIKKFGHREDFILPDRGQVTMQVPFMTAYATRLVQICHKRGAHAIGGMAAFIPSRRNAEVNRIAFEKVTADKTWEAGLGFDGTWVAHPDLVPVARKAFDAVLQGRSHQKEVMPNRIVNAFDLLHVCIPNGRITRSGLITNIDVGIRYIASWLGGIGAAAIHNLMEDAATAEISRAQVWQWLRQECLLEDRTPVTAALIQYHAAQVCNQLLQEIGEEAYRENRYDEACQLFLKLVLSRRFEEFLTLPAYPMID
jgi:malate synthase